MTWEYLGTRGRGAAYSRKREEYMADFCLISRRVLDPADHQLFRFHFLLGADWRLCARRLHVERAVLFRSLARIERKLGKAFAETEPYGLFPIDEYFGGVVRDEAVHATVPVRADSAGRLRPPIRRAA
ncbi:MAG: hypothetical protein KGN36_20310 [Acidobacteriota bacterium]|nr:hypothetical protein [Acidobacteriota bacterium]